MEKIQWKPLLLSILISLGTGTLAGLLTSGSMEKYQTLYHPPLAPPGWVFPVVWTILYFLMGVAAYRVYVSGNDDTKQALLIYGAQLLVNALWPLLFFKLDAYFFSFIWLLLLFDLVLLTARCFSMIDQIAGKLFITYLIWLVFAGYLNLAYLIHNLFN